MEKIEDIIKEGITFFCFSAEPGRAMIITDEVLAGKFIAVNDGAGYAALDAAGLREMIG